MCLFLHAEAIVIMVPWMHLAVVDICGFFHKAIT